MSNIKEAESKTAKCPTCGGKYLVATNYCLKCKKKVKKESVVIEVKEDVKIGDIILEAGDKIKVLEMSDTMFRNEFPVSVDNAKRISTKYQSPWVQDSSTEWTLYVSGQHAMTFLPKEGKLFTDLNMNDINDMLR